MKCINDFGEIEWAMLVMKDKNGNLSRKIVHVDDINPQDPNFVRWVGIRPNYHIIGTLMIEVEELKEEVQKLKGATQ